MNVQASQLQLDELELHVYSELLREPELMIVSRVVDEAGVERCRDHERLPDAVIADFRTRGEIALAHCLRVSHLRYVQGLLANPKRDPRAPQTEPGAGLLGARIYDERGRTLRSFGAEQVPASWLAVEPWFIELCERLARALELGSTRWCVCQGPGIAVVLTTGEAKGANQLRLAYITPSTRSSAAVRGPERERLAALLEAL